MTPDCARHFKRAVVEQRRRDWGDNGIAYDCAYLVRCLLLNPARATNDR